MNKSSPYFIGWLSVISNIILFALKLWIGIMSGSVAMLADAWHTISDSMTSFIFIFSYWLSKKKPDDKHPFGHGRTENIGALILAFILFHVGVDFFRESIIKLNNPRNVEYGGFAFVVFISSALFKEYLAKLSYRVGKDIDSKALIADGCHHRTDAVISVTIAICMLFRTKFGLLDSILGIAISVWIIYISYSIVRDTVSSLLGEKVNPEIEEKINEIIRNNSENVSSVHHIHIHEYGNHKELTLHICLPGNTTLTAGHEIINKLEQLLKEELEIEPTIHMEPFKH